MAAGSASTTVGVTGQPWRASVSPWGAVTPWGRTDSVDGHRSLEWFIAADDRWHRPELEPAVRQRRLGGAPVTETRVRVPDGDAVQRVWSVADGGGATIIEVENDSPLPLAIAFAGLAVATDRPPADVAIQGIDLPDDAVLLPLGHHAVIRVALPHVGRAGGRGSSRLATLPGAADVVRGWTAVAGRASRLDVPDDGLAEAVVAARCDLMLEGPVEARDDAIGFVLDVGELVRCGDAADAWLPAIVGPLEAVAGTGVPGLDAALAAAARIAIAAGDARATGDIERLATRTSPPPLAVGSFSDLSRGHSVGRFVHDVERHLARGSDLLPAGLPTRWLGANFEVHGIPTSSRSTVSYAVRWHGDRPAVLWEQTGPAQRLTASAVDAAWSTDAMSGEALWAAPPRRSGSSLVVTATPAPSAAGPPQSFT